MSTYGAQWRHHEITALEIGLDLNYYWELTPKQFQKHVTAYHTRRKENEKRTDQLNYLLGAYVGSAVNNGKHYPKEPFLSQKKRRAMTPEEMEEQAIRNTIKLGGNLK